MRKFIIYPCTINLVRVNYEKVYTHNKFDKKKNVYRQIASDK